MPQDLTAATSLADLQAQLAAAGMLGIQPMRQPLPLPSMQGGVTEAQIAALINKAFTEHMPDMHRAVQSFEVVFAKALAPEDYAAFQNYVANGSPGFAAMIEGGAFHPLAQLLWETIKENTP